MRIVWEKVKPQRDLVKRKSNRENWWIYAENRPGLYKIIAPLERVLAITLVSRTVAFSFLPADWVYAHRLAVFAYENHTHFALLQSSIHYFWAWKYSSTLKSDLNYSPSDCFTTFPHPINMNSLETIGGIYHEHRCQIMLARREGLTKTHNRIHDPKESSADITHLRQLHLEMDNAVATAYRWSDLDLGHGFHETPQGLRFTISEAARREVLTRLLQLNHQRYEEEVAQGLHDKAKFKQKTKKESQPEKLMANGQLGLGLINEPAPQPEVTLELAPWPENALSASDVERWERYKCAACGKITPGFDAGIHIREVHKGVDVGFVKMG